MPATLNAATIFPIPPDADAAEVVTPEFLTNVLETESGIERRAALRERPVRRYEYTAVFGSADEAMQFRALWLSAAQPLRFVVPLWQRAATPTAIGPTTIAGDFRGRGFITGPAAAFLWLSEREFELVDVDTVSDDSIELLEAPVGEYAPGATLLVPALNAWLDPPVVDLLGPDSERVPLIFREEMRGVAGIDPTIGLAGVPLVSSVAVTQRARGSSWAGRKFVTFQATAIDEAGFVIPDIPITWNVATTASPADNVRTLLPYDGRQLHIAYDAGTATYFHVYATAGGVDSPTVADE